jgi:hypothetical protein
MVDMTSPGAVVQVPFVPTNLVVLIVHWQFNGRSGFAFDSVQGEVMQSTQGAASQRAGSQFSHQPR